MFGPGVVPPEYFNNQASFLGSGCGSKTLPSVTVIEICVHMSLRMSCSFSLSTDTAANTSSKYLRGQKLMLDECEDSLSADSEGCFCRKRLWSFVFESCSSSASFLFSSAIFCSSLSWSSFPQLTSVPCWDLMLHIRTCFLDEVDQHSENLSNKTDPFPDEAVSLLPLGPGCSTEFVNTRIYFHFSVLSGVSRSCTRFVLLFFFFKRKIHCEVRGDSNNLTQQTGFGGFRFLPSPHLQVQHGVQSSSDFN